MQKKLNRLFWLFISLIPVSLFWYGCDSADRTSLAGHWQGEIIIQSLSVAAALDIPEDQQKPVTFSIPQQYLAWIPVSDFSLRGTTVQFRLSLGTELLRFSAEFDAEAVGGPVLAGRFLQQGQAYQFSLQKAAGISEPPEEFLAIPEETGREVILSAGEVQLSGILTLPESPEPAVVVLIIAGSGPTDRDGNSALTGGRNDSLKQLSGCLIEQGIPTLRYDKRGTGISSGQPDNMPEVVFEDLVDDACRWIDILREEYHYRKIIVLGHSQGALIAMLAAGISHADAVISVAGAGRPIGDVIRGQLIRNSGMEPSAVAGIFRDFKAGKEIQHNSPLVRQLFSNEAAAFLLSWMKYDPAQVIAELDLPVLITWGEADIQTSKKDTELLAAQALQGEYLQVPDMNHVMKIAVDEYNNYLAYIDPRFPLSVEFTGGLINFIRRIL